MKPIFLLGLFILLACLNSGWAQALGIPHTSGITHTASDKASAAEQNPDSRVSRLSDEEARQLLLEKLKQEQTNPIDTSAKPAKSSPSGIMRLLKNLPHLGEQVKNSLLSITGAKNELPLIFNKGIEKFTAGRSGSGAAFLKAAAISLLTAGLITLFIYRFVWVAYRKSGDRVNRTVDKPEAPLNTFAQLKHHGFTVLSKILLLASFATIASLVFVLFFEHESRDYLAFFFYLVALCILCSAIIFFRAFYSPTDARYRLPMFTDPQAKRFFFTAVLTIAFGCISFFTCALINTLGVGGTVHQLFLMTVTGLTALLLALTVLINRKAIRYDLSYQAVSVGRRTFAIVWPWFFALAVVGLWAGLLAAELLTDHVPYSAALLTLGIMGTVPHFDALLYRAEQPDESHSEADWQAALARGLRIFLLITTLSILLFAWHLNPTQLNAHSGAGIKLTSTLISVSLIIAIAYAFWHISTVFIDRRIAAEDRAMGNDKDITDSEIGGAGLSRTRTLLPLLKRSIQAVIFLTTLFSVLAEFGVNITPLLAGAGVLGLAIGFGSQTLVRDVVSGAFFLLDDAVRIGEYIDVGSVQGSVEKMSIRSLQLRHHLGAVHTIPFGEIKTLTNHSRDWVIMKLRFRLPFDTDLEKVRKLLKKVGEQLEQEDIIKEDFIQRFKSQGAIETDDHGFVISTKFMSKPGKQFLIRRYAFNAIQKSFEANGIQFARPTVSVKADFDQHDEENTKEAETEREREKERERKILGAASSQIAEDIRLRQLQEATTDRPPPPFK